MEQIKAHIAVSLDGHTATPDYELDWLPDKVKAIIGKYYLDADCLLMGANTDRKSTRLNSSHSAKSRMPSSA